jgi:hypothetical protein
MNAAPPVALRVGIIFFRLTSLELAFLFFAVILGWSQSDLEPALALPGGPRESRGPHCRLGQFIRTR